MIAFKCNNMWFPEVETPIPGVLLLNETDGRIAEAGPELSVPAGAELRDLGNAYLLPSFIDCHSHMGMDGPGGDPCLDSNEPHTQICPQLRAVDAVDFQHPGFSQALAAGVTLLGILPGADCVVGGQVGVMTACGEILSENAGMKCALGRRPRESAAQTGQSPQTKIAAVAMLRESLLRAKSAQGENSLRRDLALEGWMPLLQGKTPLRLHAYRAHEMRSALKLAEEFGFKLVIEHGAEALSLKDELLQKKVPIVVTDTYFRVPQTPEEGAMVPELPALLMKARLPVALSCNFPEVPPQALSQLGSLCLREGASFRQVMDSLTLIPAEILGMEGETAALEKGKFADLAIWSGHPFRFGSRLLESYVRGCKAYESDEKVCRGGCPCC